jgi:hypothetical protein
MKDIALVVCIPRVLTSAMKGLSFSKVSHLPFPTKGELGLKNSADTSLWSVDAVYA